MLVNKEGSEGELLVLLENKRRALLAAQALAVIVSTIVFVSKFATVVILTLDMTCE